MECYVKGLISFAMMAAFAMPCWVVVWGLWGRRQGKGQWRGVYKLSRWHSYVVTPLLHLLSLYEHFVLNYDCCLQYRVACKSCWESNGMELLRRTPFLLHSADPLSHHPWGVVHLRGLMNAAVWHCPLLCSTTLLTLRTSLGLMITNCCSDTFSSVSPAPQHTYY